MLLPVLGWARVSSPVRFGVIPRNVVGHKKSFLHSAEWSAIPRNARAAWEGGAGPFAEFRVSLCEGAARWRGSQTLPDCGALHSLARAEKGIQARAALGRFDAAWVAAFHRWRARGAIKIVEKSMILC